eukprot:jgi/Galph1/107/GphlegSOOS_G4776.1
MEKDDSIVTMVDIAQQQESEEQFGVESSCTFPMDCASQEVYGCRLCSKEQTPSGFCLGCRNVCHGDHIEQTYELYSKRDFCCDCGNQQMVNICKLFPEKPPVNEGNKYNHNFFNRFCYCDEEYTEDTEDMLQCLVCEDWFHVSCLKLEASWFEGNVLETEFDLCCSGCITKYSYLRRLVDLHRKNVLEARVFHKLCIFENLSETSRNATCVDYCWPSDWKNLICNCEQCKEALVEQGLTFLLTEVETDGQESYVSSLMTSPLLERMFAERYAAARELLYEELRPFAESKSVVTEQDMNVILDRLKSRLSNSTTVS